MKTVNIAGIYAVIREEDLPSIRAFEAAGFRLTYGNAIPAGTVSAEQGTAVWVVASNREAK